MKLFNRLARRLSLDQAVVSDLYVPRVGTDVDRNRAVLAALVLVAAGALYIHLRWRRSPPAWRAMIGLAICYFLAGSITGAWIVRFSASGSIGPQPGRGEPVASTATPMPSVPMPNSGPTEASSPLVEYDPAHSVLPDPWLTPWRPLPAVTAADVCTPGWAREHRHITEPMRDQVYAEYGRTRGPDCCEVDHLIPLGLGGSNDIKNLWPQPDDPRPRWGEKDGWC
jgi:hypothetical protein